MPKRPGAGNRECGGRFREHGGNGGVAMHRLRHCRFIVARVHGQLLEHGGVLLAEGGYREVVDLAGHQTGGFTRACQGSRFRGETCMLPRRLILTVGTEQNDACA